MQDNLVVVEAPAKAKTIEKVLGKGYVVRVPSSKEDSCCIRD